MKRGLDDGSSRYGGGADGAPVSRNSVSITVHIVVFVVYFFFNMIFFILSELSGAAGSSGLYWLLTGIRFLTSCLYLYALMRSFSHGRAPSVAVGILGGPVLSILLAAPIMMVIF